MDIFGGNIDLQSILLVGDYGSGKTEVAVNLALRLAATTTRQVAIADLDLVNPYFRCREATEPLEQAGIRVVSPTGGQRYADLPILLPQVKGLLQDPSVLSVLDVGGDEVGSRVLANLAPAARLGRHALWFVTNASRPFNDTVKGCVATVRRIEASSHMTVAGLVANTHLMTETTPQMVLDGLALTHEVAAALGVHVAFAAVMHTVAEQLDSSALGCELLTMRRIMVPPWLHRDLPVAGPDLFRLRPI